MPRFYIPALIAPDQTLDLPPGAARHAQVLRLQPGDEATLFTGEGGQWQARIVRMGKNAVTVQALAHQAIEREAARAVHLLAGWIAADRMDWLVEKATELGAASLTPVITARTQQRQAGSGMDKKLAHWRAIVAAASEQCGRNRLMAIGAPVTLDAAVLAPSPRERGEGWGEGKNSNAGASFTPPHPNPLPTSVGRGSESCAISARWLLSLASGANAAPAQSVRAACDVLPHGAPVTLLSGPEGGFTPQEEAAACAAHWQPVTLGARTLRAETAPLAALAALTAV